MRSLFLILVLSVSVFSAVEVIYVKQTAAGSDNGVDSANAHAISWLNTSGYWGTDAGDFSPGDTVYLCGTFTSQLTIQASGSSGNTYYIKFAPGAKFSQTVWTTGNTNARIYGTGKDYIVIDGCDVGIIEATDNGTSLTNHVDITGMFFESCDHVEVKNLTIRNLYVRTGDADGTSAGQGMTFDGTYTDLDVHDCTLDWMVNGISVGAGSGGTATDIEIYGNTVTRVNHSIASGSAGTTSDLRIHDNECSQFSVWDHNPGNNHHHNAIHMYAITGTHSNVKIYNNAFYGGFGTRATSAIFVESNYSDIYIYNNLLYSIDASWPANGYITLKQGGSGQHVYNNTIDGSAANPGGSGVFIQSTVETTDYVVVKNNILMHLAAPIYEDAGNNNVISDYNNIHGTTGGMTVCWRAIPYSSMTGTFTNCETVTGQTSGATGKFWRTNAGTLQIRYAVGTFSSGGETILGASSGAYVVSTGSGSDATGGNVAIGDWQSLTCNDAHSTTTDPDLNANYTPKSSSTIIDAGTTLTEFSTDKNGNTRPFNYVWDMGAYEYGASSYLLTKPYFYVVSKPTDSTIIVKARNKNMDFWLKRKTGGTTVAGPVTVAAGNSDTLTYSGNDSCTIFGRTK